MVVGFGFIITAIAAPTFIPEPSPPPQTPANQCYFFRINHPTCKQYAGFYELAATTTGLHWLVILLLLTLLVAEKIRERKKFEGSGGSGMTSPEPRGRASLSGFQLFLVYACLGLLGWAMANTVSVYFSGGVPPALQYTFSGFGTFFYYMSAVQFVDLVLRTSPAEEYWKRLRGAETSVSVRRNSLKFVREVLLKIVAPVLLGLWVILWIVGGELNALTFDGSYAELRGSYNILQFVSQAYLLMCWLFLLGAAIVAREAWKLNIKKANDALTYSASEADSDPQPPSNSDNVVEIAVPKKTPASGDEVAQTGTSSDRVVRGRQTHRTAGSIDTARSVPTSPIAPTRSISYSVQMNRAYGGEYPPLPSPPSLTAGIGSHSRSPSPRGAQHANQYFSPIPTFAQQNPYDVSPPKFSTVGSSGEVPDMSRQSSDNGLLLPSSPPRYGVYPPGRTSGDRNEQVGSGPLALDYGTQTGTFQRLGSSPAWPVRPSWEQQQQQQQQQQAEDESQVASGNSRVGANGSGGATGRRGGANDAARQIRNVLRRGQRTLDLFVVVLTLFNLFSVSYAVCLLYFANATEDGRWPPILYFFTLLINYSVGMFAFLVIGANNLGKLYGHAR
ncbi:hypothetical protein BJ742DRAFT_454467 [Cladochytrium replicatum]|nr:hypothetical protein BJ742DRAFT_454467 [Cladochytrium replicatum]